MLNSKEKLYDFIKMKYNISPDISDRYNLLYFEKAKQSLLYYKDFTQVSDRLLFPIKDHETGLIVGYQCRNANLKLTERCKYINISDYEDKLDIGDNGKKYRKMIPLPIGNFLFNLYELKDESIKSIWITEGIADAIKLNSLAYKTISPGQSNLTEHQIQLLDRFWGKDLEINLFFDTDSHKIGQTNSIKIAYKLWQFGFKNINIIRTYAELGKDITDCSVKLKDDAILVTFINLWYKYAYKFRPAPNEDLDTLINTGVYNKDTALKIDPRDIERQIEFSIKYNDIKDYIGYMDKNIGKDPISKLQNGDIIFIHELITKIKENLKDKVDDTVNSESLCNPLDINISVSEDITSVESNLDPLFTKLSDAQIFLLKKKFDIETLKIIDEYLTEKQINSIVWQVKANKDFDLNNSLKSSSYKEKINNKDTFTTNTTRTDFSIIDKDFKPVFPEDPNDPAPF